MGLTTWRGIILHYTERVYVHISRSNARVFPEAVRKRTA